MPGTVYSSVIEWNGARLTGSVKTAARRGTRKAAEWLRGESVPLAPLDWGTLREAATVKGVNAEPIALVVYDTPYAAIQHEREDFRHPKAGQADYLGQPMRNGKAIMYGIIAAEVRVAILTA